MFAVPTGTWASKNNQPLYAPLPKASALRSLKEKGSVGDTDWPEPELFIFHIRDCQRVRRNFIPIQKIIAFPLSLNAARWVKYILSFQKKRNNKIMRLKEVRRSSVSSPSLKAGRSTPISLLRRWSNLFLMTCDEDITASQVLHCPALPPPLVFLKLRRGFFCCTLSFILESIIGMVIWFLGVSLLTVSHPHAELLLCL